MTKKIRCMFIYGTRPEIIKLAPIVLAMREKRNLFDCLLIFTGQHRELGHQALDIFGLVNDLDLNLMEDDQQTTEFLGRALSSLDRPMRTYNPRWVLVQGDTSSALAGAIAGFNRNIAVAHVEAGLRTNDLSAPHPEEGYRQMISRIASLHFAPTQRAKAALVGELVSNDRIFVTGNTVVDAVQWMVRQFRPMEDALIRSVVECANSKLILTTLHRREAFGQPLVNMLEAIKVLACDPALGLTFLFVVHPNPHIAEAVNSILANQENVKLLPPLDYERVLALMSLSWLVLTDSGGLQEEAPCFSIPVLVMRECTERMEGIDAGIAKLVGTDKTRIIESVRTLVQDQSAYARMRGAVNPYGKGDAARAIAHRLSQQSWSL